MSRRMTVVLHDEDLYTNLKVQAAKTAQTVKRYYP